ncbi:hypothetical protein RvY_15105-2 [Ramazzottius varieornatus]|uniref:Uncharacterized protein n=1 Tax=Ramazzottius varieornatus TaxID=947166 RepID=A0A1D1VTP7_RAMVA|nr:hypothetical protein RvY_15105-2 [Ramazzottius varieornatus]
MWKPPGDSKIGMNYPLVLFVILTTCRVSSSFWVSTPKPPYRFRNFEDEYIFGLAVRMGGQHSRLPLGWTGNPTIPTRPSTPSATTTRPTTASTTTASTTTSTTTLTTTTSTTTSTTTASTLPSTRPSTTKPTPPTTPKPIITECYVCNPTGLYLIPGQTLGPPDVIRSRCNQDKVTCKEDMDDAATGFSGRSVCIAINGNYTMTQFIDNVYTTAWGSMSSHSIFQLLHQI